MTKSKHMVRVFRVKLVCNYYVSYDNVVNPQQVYKVDPLAHDFLILNISQNLLNLFKESISFKKPIISTSRHLVIAKLDGKSIVHKLNSNQ